MQVGDYAFRKHAQTTGYFFPPSVLKSESWKKIDYCVFRKLHCWTEFIIIQPGMINKFWYDYCFLDYTESTSKETGKPWMELRSSLDLLWPVFPHSLNDLILEMGALLISFRALLPLTFESIWYMVYLDNTKHPGLISNACNQRKIQDVIDL